MAWNLASWSSNCAKRHLILVEHVTTSVVTGIKVEQCDHAMRLFGLSLIVHASNNRVNTSHSIE